MTDGPTDRPALDEALAALTACAGDAVLGTAFAKGEFGTGALLGVILFVILGRTRTANGLGENLVEGEFHVGVVHEVVLLGNGHGDEHAHVNVHHYRHQHSDQYAHGHVHRYRRC